METYQIELSDYFPETGDDTQVKTTLFPKKFSDFEEAANTGWRVLMQICALADLALENQGDQFMAYYKDGHECEGLGAYTMRILDENGEPQDL